MYIQTVLNIFDVFSFFTKYIPAFIIKYIFMSTSTPNIMALNNVRRCRLCREEGHNIRRCPRVSVIDNEYLERIMRFLVIHDIHDITTAMNYRFTWLSNRPILELRCLAKLHNLAIEIMNKHDVYRALKRVYITTSLDEINSYFLIETARYYRNLYSTVSFIDMMIRYEEDTIRLPENTITFFKFYIEHPDDAIISKIKNGVECPICYEIYKLHTDVITLNCSHNICRGCFMKYIDSLKSNMLDRNSNFEMCTPKCPLCRDIIHTLYCDENKIQCDSDIQKYN